MNYRTIAAATFIAAAVAAIANVIAANVIRSYDHVADLGDLFDDGGEAYEPPENVEEPKRLCEWWRWDGCKTDTDICQWPNCPTTPEIVETIADTQQLAATVATTEIVEEP